MSNSMITFQAGQTYQVRSLGNWDCIFSFEVVTRTAKTVWLDEGYGEGWKARRILVRDGVETCKPYGTYSLSPALRADRKEA